MPQYALATLLVLAAHARPTIHVSQLVCPKCKRIGRVSWEESASLLHSRKRAVRDLSAGFISIDTGSKKGPRIYCQDCRVPTDEHALT
jgi:hypothetical protein